ncbi:MAG TPA: PHP domain-containing protein [Galbitalea sp.]|jgi:putative hydrolase
MSDVRASGLLRGDYHVHSSWSNDAVSSVAENITAAAAAGLSELRLIDHVRQSSPWVPEFIAEVRRQPALDGLAVYTGVETKILNSRGELDLPPGVGIGDGVDAIVIADHQFPGTDGAWTPELTRRKLDDGLATSDALDLLVGALVAAMESVESGQLAHCFSILPKVGLDEADLSDEHLRVWANAAAATGTAIEVNEKWGCPGPRALRAALGAGATFVASTDSHVATDVGRYDRVVALLAEAGVPS